MLGDFVFILQASRKKPGKECKHEAGEFPVRFVSPEDLSGCSEKNCLDRTAVDRGRPKRMLLQYFRQEVMMATGLRW